jgi:hypothetical protein
MHGTLKLACRYCGTPLPEPKRGQVRKYCSSRCRKAASRASLCVTRSLPATQPPGRCDTASAPAPQPPDAPLTPPSYGWGKPGDPPLQGDDYPLEYYEDGYPKLPGCLDRGQSRGQSNVEDDNDESKYQRPPKQRHGSSSGFDEGRRP